MKVPHTSTGQACAGVAVETHPVPLELQLGPVSLHLSTAQQLLQLLQQSMHLQDNSAHVCTHAHTILLDVVHIEMHNAC